jgi:hypothetical protein
VPRIDEDGPGGPSGGGTIRYPAIVTTLGQDYLGKWGEQTHEEIKRVQDTYAQPQHFGDIPAARDFATVYSAAQHVYEATLRGIRQDLEDAATALAEAGERIRANDEVSADSFQTLNARWSTDGGFGSTQEQQAASDDQQVQEAEEAQVRLDEAGTEEGGQGGQGGPGTEGTPTSEGGPTMDTDAGPTEGPTMDTGGTGTDG